jgi:hypothetical protein
MQGAYPGRHAGVRREQNLSYPFILGDPTIDQPLNNILDPVNEISESLKPNTHRGSLQIVSGAEQLFKTVTRPTRAQSKARRLERVQHFQRVVDEAFDKLSVYLYWRAHFVSSTPLAGSNETSPILSNKSAND